MSVLFSYCFLPYKCYFRKFNVLVFHPLWRQGKTRLSYAARRKSSKNYLSSTPIAPIFAWAWIEDFPSLVPNIEPWPQEEEKCSLKIGTWRFHGTALVRGVLNVFVVLSTFRKSRPSFLRVLHTMMRWSWDVTIWNKPCFFGSISQTYSWLDPLFGSGPCFL